MLWIALLIVHGLVALFLLGAVTHQVVSSLWRAPSRNFVGRFASVPSRSYANAVVVTYLVTFTFGGWLYTEYRYRIKPVLLDLGLSWQVGLFEFKEHIAAIGLLLLPVYWYFWKRAPADASRSARMALTILIAASVWLSFITGHILNNARGF